MRIFLLRVTRTIINLRLYLWLQEKETILQPSKKPLIWRKHLPGISVGIRRMLPNKLFIDTFQNPSRKNSKMYYWTIFTRIFSLFSELSTVSFIKFSFLKPPCTECGFRWSNKLFPSFSFKIHKKKLPA